MRPCEVRRAPPPPPHSHRQLLAVQFCRSTPRPASPASDRAARGACNTLECRARPALLHPEPCSIHTQLEILTEEIPTRSQGETERGGNCSPQSPHTREFCAESRHRRTRTRLSAPPMGPARRAYSVSPALWARRSRHGGRHSNCFGAPRRRWAHGARRSEAFNDRTLRRLHTTVTCADSTLSTVRRGEKRERERETERD